MLSGSYWETLSPLPEFITGDLLATDIYADITAPAMRAWIESIVDRNADGRWEGETDYLRTSFGTPGCDVLSNPGCDPGCNAALDPDCDFVVSANDNCPNDYNPDQLNSDDPLDALDRSSPFDPGDACDVCPQLPDNGDNCNEDGEYLTWGPRPALREDDVIGPPLNPTPALIVSQLPTRYRGDACDPWPCTELGRLEQPLDGGKYGAPSGVQCGTLPVIGGSCSWAAPSKIERSPTRAGAPTVGDTGYRFCQCDSPFEQQADRLQNCLQGGTLCPWRAVEFAQSTQLKELTVNPPFSSFALGGGVIERGTTNDSFTYPAALPRPSFDWLFEADQANFVGTPNPALPLDAAGASAISIDGLIQSNVRRHVLITLPGQGDLSSYWMPMQLRVRAHISGGKIPLQDFFRIPGWWRSACKHDPNCRFGLAVPVYVFPRPAVSPALIGVTAAGASSVTDLAAETALALLASPSDAVIPAAEHASLLAARGAEFAPRLAFIDLSTLTFSGAIAQRADGRLVETRGIIIDPGDELAFAQCAGQPSLSCPGAQSASAQASTAAATLSALHGALFVLRRAVDEPHARMHVLNVLARQWTELPLEGKHLPSDPVAMTYVSQHNALFVLARGATKKSKKTKTGGKHDEHDEHGKDDDKYKKNLLRLYRIDLSGHVDVLATGFDGFQGDLYLTPGEDGTLLLSSSRNHPARYRVVQLRVGTKGVHAVGRLHGKRVLAAAPFVTQRALTLPLDDGAGNLEVEELDLTSLQPPQGCGPLWATE
ncbi:MAG: hypothetical protein R3B13_04570 [Polyangiaceae bacterium]